jgi:hypothetical protein
VFNSHDGVGWDGGWQRTQRTRAGEGEGREWHEGVMPREARERAGKKRNRESQTERVDRFVVRF